MKYLILAFFLLWMSCADNILCGKDSDKETPDTVYSVYNTEGYAKVTYKVESGGRFGIELLQPQYHYMTFEQANVEFNILISVSDDIEFIGMGINQNPRDPQGKYVTDEFVEIIGSIYINDELVICDTVPPDTTYYKFLSVDLEDWKSHD